MLSVTDLSRAMRTVLTTTADEAGRRTGCIKRVRKFTGSTLCQTLVFGWLAKPQATLSDLCQGAATLGVEVSEQSLDERFTPEAAALLKEVLAAAVEQVLAAESVSIPLLRRFCGVYVQDCTQVTLPPQLADLWQGCGDATETGHTAVIKLGMRLDLLQGRLHGPALAQGKSHDRRVVEHLPTLPAGSLLLADLGFFSLPALAASAARKVHFITRIQAGTFLYDQLGTRWSLATFLAAQPAGPVDCWIDLGATQRLRCRLIAVRVPVWVANERRRRMKEEARRRGQAVTAERLQLADWTVLATTVPVETLTIQEVLVLARARWQIELLIKLWKSQGEIDQSRSEQPDRILCELYAKLIAMVVQHWILLTGCWTAPDKSLVKATATVRDFARCLAPALAYPTRLRHRLTDLMTALRAGCRMNTRTTKPNAYQVLLNPALVPQT
jgi:Transposase DDE domain